MDSILPCCAQLPTNVSWDDIFDAIYGATDTKFASMHARGKYLITVMMETNMLCATCCDPLPADQLAAFVTRITDEKFRVVCDDMERMAPWTPDLLLLYFSCHAGLATWLGQEPPGEHVPQGCAALDG
jgi:hypothetical protein